MTDKLTPAELRLRAREHRAAAKRDHNVATRKAHSTLALEYERLADELERTQDHKKKPAG